MFNEQSFVITFATHFLTTAITICTDQGTFEGTCIMSVLEKVKGKMACDVPDDSMENFTKVNDFYESSGFVTPHNVAESVGGGFSSLVRRDEMDSMIDTMLPEDGESGEYPLLGTNCVPKIMPDIHEHIGEGTTGHVYSMLTRRGPMAVKFQKHSSEYGKTPFVPGNASMDVPMNEFALEVAIQLRMSCVGTSPNVFNAWISPYSTTWGGSEQDVLVMDRLHETLFVKTNREPSYTNGVFELVAKMHDHNVFHGDLHSGNLMVGEDHKPWIIDFGKSKSMPRRQEERRWCIVHDYFNLHNSLLRRSELKLLLRGKILELAHDRTVLGTTFDLDP